ncbi:hypothetical protein I6N90_03910 [Paenibacillus sp. GSMTC-2017]|uniref:hypothetical protein n=1 Tax=Paenibacillus sp. GSMTC-2017 TaxID=2794350 RepID=UPI0018D5F755|nr:hypothetical protein [Paenibacillus sp. GSMTC-2017]MBH5316950.1 hypothetical protein [Paenibacillus sp. GSMTC-2017]
MKTCSLIILALLLSGCTTNGDRNKSSTIIIIPSALPSQFVLIENSATTTPHPTQTANITLDIKTANLIGESDNGLIYEADGHLYLLREGEETIEIGNPAITKKSVDLSNDGKTLLYQFVDKSIEPFKVRLATYSIAESKEDILETEDYHFDLYKSINWFGQNIFMQTDSRLIPSDFILLNGSTGEQILSGRVFGTVLDSNDRSLKILLGNNGQSDPSVRTPTVIKALAEDGTLNKLFEEDLYEEQFLDIRISDHLSTIAAWTHIVPAGKSRLWIATLNKSNWEVGQWKIHDTKFAREGTISFNSTETKIELSNGQTFPVPSSSIQ